MTEVLDFGYVKLVEPNGVWGSDEAIIEAARMSTNKGFQGWGPVYYSCSCHNPDSCEKCKGKGNYEVPGDEKLLRYLWEHKHHTPFEMAGMVIEVQAPIMVFREWHRHRTQSYNEMSGRYTELPDLYYTPSIERLMNGAQSRTNKQGSEMAFTEDQARSLQERFLDIQRSQREAYVLLLRSGLARELARLVLPVCQFSRMRASANLRNWLQFLTLRMAPDAQWEIRQYANAVAELVKQHFPRTYGLFEEGLT